MKGLFRTNLVAAFMLFFAASTAYAAPNILSATINYTTNQITVNGTALVKGTSIPKLVFNGTSNLAVIGTPLATAITAQLPNSLEPGTYELKVVNGYGTSGDFDVTYGAAGPQGLKGDTGTSGLKGDKGDTGAAGPTTIQSLSHSQIFTSNGTFIVPTGINYVMVDMCGGGGGGGSNEIDPPVSDYIIDRGGGGGGGGYLNAVVPVAPGDSIPVTVGASGAGAGSNIEVDGQPGGDSYFDALLFAGGGQGGKSYENGGVDGAGGFVTGGANSIIGPSGASAGQMIVPYYPQGTCVEQGGAGRHIVFYPGTAGTINMPAEDGCPGYVRVSW